MDDEDAHLLSNLLKGSGLVFVGMLFEVGVAFAGKLVVARIFGPVEYGVISVGTTLLTFSGIVLVLGLNSGIGRYIPRYDDPSRIRGVLVSGFQIAIPLSLAATLVLFVLSPRLANIIDAGGTTIRVLRLFSAAIPFAVFLRMVNGSMQGFKLPLPKTVLQNVSLPVVRIVGIAVVVALGLDSASVAWAYLVSYLLTAFLGLWFLHSRTPIFNWSVQYTPVRRRLLTFSAPLVVSAAMSAVFSDIDIFLLGALAGAGPVGEYNAVYPLAQFLTMIVSAFGFLFVPVISELHADGDHDALRRLIRTITKWALLANLPLTLLLSLFPETIVSITFGPKYVAAAPVLPILAVGFFVHTAAALSGNTLTSIGKTRLIMYDNFLVAVLNVVLNVALIPDFGAFGAALATTASYLTLGVLYIYQIWDHIDVTPISMSLFKPAVVATIVAGLVYLPVVATLQRSALSLVVACVLYAPLFIIVVLRTGGIEAEEVRLVLMFEERFGIDLSPFKTVVRKLIGEEF